MQPPLSLKSLVIHAIDYSNFAGKVNNTAGTGKKFSFINTLEKQEISQFMTGVFIIKFYKKFDIKLAVIFADSC